METLITFLCLSNIFLLYVSYRQGRMIERIEEDNERLNGK